MDTGPKELLRRLRLLEGRAQQPVEPRHILRGAVRQAAVALAPDMLSRVKLRGVSLEGLHVNPGMPVKEVLNLATPVNRALIPEKDNRPSEVSKEGLEETPEIEAVETPLLQAHVEGQVVPLGRDRKGADGGDVALLVEIPGIGRLAFGRTSPFKVRDEEEPTLVEEDQVRPPPLGVFLYAATGRSSNARSPLRPVAGASAPVSDNSSPGLSRASRGERGDRSPESASRSTGRCAVASTTRWNSRRPRRLSQGASPESFSGGSKAALGVPGWEEGEARSSPSFGSFATTETPNLQKPLPLELLPADCVLASSVGWRAGAASPTGEVYRRVSCILG